MSHDPIKTAMLNRIDHARDVIARHLSELQRAYFQPGDRHLDLDQVKADEEAIAIASRVITTCASELRALGHDEEANALESQITA